MFVGAARSACLTTVRRVLRPVSMLDVSIRAEVLQVLDRLRHNMSVAVLMITNDLSIAAHYADRIAVIYLGLIVELGPARMVVRSPRHPYARAHRRGAECRGTGTIDDADFP